MQHILGSVGLPSADILGLINDVRWPEDSGDLRRGHRKLLTSGTQRKHPNKRAGQSVNRKIHKGRHLVQVRDAFRDLRTHSSSVWRFLYWHTVFPCFRMSCVRAADCIHHRVALVYSKKKKKKETKTGIMICVMEFWHLGCNQSRGIDSFPPVFLQKIAQMINWWLPTQTCAGTARFLQRD